MIGDDATCAKVKTRLLITIRNLRLGKIGDKRFTKVWP